MLSSSPDNIKMDYNVKKWCHVLENTFLTYYWTEHAKKYTYTERTEASPKHIEKILLAYNKGNNQYIRETEGNRPNTKRILHVIPHIPKLITVVIDTTQTNCWKIVTYYYTDKEEEIRNKFGNYDNLA
ncbi:hypothetical protein RclHR1_00380040 [Rhizophagus clarus]|uniref:Uncharacterized protein n=1 Tax=Rhizophagus clarus TaxID=94130 RepID=A0A2Z6RUP3_9GLOM|nr:hypothetical protein RclHR1_00380040 [Rhizophagus clarus]GET01486.1 hypothetical protein GLOIN_2v1785215 [Rhizophagus clarus]